MESSMIDSGPSRLTRRHVRIELPDDVKTISDLHSSMFFAPGKGRKGAFQEGPPIFSLNAENPLEGRVKRRHISLSPVEAVVLHRLLIDEPTCSNALWNPSQGGTKTHRLNDDILFSAPNDLAEARIPESMRVGNRGQRQSILGLWKAHAAGIAPRTLVERSFKPLSEAERLASMHGLCGNRAPPSSTVDRPQLPRTMSGTVLCGATRQSPGLEFNRPRQMVRRTKSESFLQQFADFSPDDDDFCASDQEVRPKDQNSSCSSFDDDDEQRTGLFDTWEILSDEYSNDFGFDTHSSPGSVLILGTGVHDTKAHPHVMSPPLLDALMAHLPLSLRGENYWLKYSLIRDGASFDTFKRYVRSSQYNILAIETDEGEVFGSFSSSPWRNHFGFFGGPPAFVWKMRQSRQTRCTSLYDQARLESRISVYPYSGKGCLVQVCQHDLLAVGGDESMEDNLVRAPSAERSSGFAFALHSDLLRGTTSPCSSFQSPALCGKDDTSSVFCTAGLEVWTLTPCRDVDSAEKLEMAKYITEESSSRIMKSPTLGSARVPSTYGSSDLDSQRSFFRRVGDDKELGERRQTWQASSDLNCDVGSPPYRSLRFSPK